MNLVVGSIVQYISSQHPAGCLPAIVTRVWSSTHADLKVIGFDDGEDVFKAGVGEGSAEGNWRWPV